MHRGACTDACVCFFVLCNRHWFNRAPGPDPRGTEMGVTYLPFVEAEIEDSDSLIENIFQVK